MQYISGYIMADVILQSAIMIRWDGWSDALSGVREYLVEVFRLKPNSDERLVEKTPLEPVFTDVVEHVEGKMTLTYTPSEPGMYRLYFRIVYIYISVCAGLVK